MLETRVVLRRISRPFTDGLWGGEKRRLRLVPKRGDEPKGARRDVLVGRSSSRRLREVGTRVFRGVGCPRTTVPCRCSRRTTSGATW